MCSQFTVFKIKNILLCFCLLFVYCLPVLADNTLFLNTFIYTAPSKYFNDIPTDQRERFVQYSSGEGMLDYNNGWLTYFCDNPRYDIGTSLFWVKLLPRKGQYPLVFVYMVRPILPGKAHSKNQTYVLDGNKLGWRDVTTQYIPKDLDSTMEFIPIRKGNDIQVVYYRENECRLILHWNGASFNKRKIRPRKIDLGASE